MNDSFRHAYGVPVTVHWTVTPSEREAIKALPFGEGGPPKAVGEVLSRCAYGGR